MKSALLASSLTFSLLGLTVFAEAPAPTPPDEQAGAARGEAPPERIITITYDGGTRNSPDLRYGPYIYESPREDGIVGEVSNLTIFTQRGELRAPPEVLIAEAEGQRTATFSGGVRVERGRLTATGPNLEYSEATGLGVMPQKTAILIDPEEPDEEVVNIAADRVTFDVDTDTSTSEGNVQLTNGNQEATADTMIYEEERDLAILRSDNGQVEVRRRNDDGTFLTITADDTRVLTGTDTLLATGNVTIIDGAVTSTGDTVYYDDETSRAEIIGNPAESVDEEFGSTIRGGRIEQRTDTDVVRQLSDPTPSFDATQFEPTGEQPAGSPQSGGG
jgi:lipopolysaccharide transport protein LptA